MRTEATQRRERGTVLERGVQREGSGGMEQSTRWKKSNEKIERSGEEKGAMKDGRKR